MGKKSLKRRIQVTDSACFGHLSDLLYTTDCRIPDFEDRSDILGESFVPQASGAIATGSGFAFLWFEFKTDRLWDKRFVPLC